MEANRGRATVIGDGITVPSPSTYLPFAPDDKMDWTDYHYDIYYPAVELAIGARREITPEEAEQTALLDEVQEAIERGDANWTELLNSSLGTPDFEAMVGDMNFLGDIEKQLDAQLREDE